MAYNYRLKLTVARTVVGKFNTLLNFFLSYTLSPWPVRNHRKPTVSDLFVATSMFFFSDFLSKVYPRRDGKNIENHGSSCYYGRWTGGINRGISKPDSVKPREPFPVIVDPSLYDFRGISRGPPKAFGSVRLGPRFRRGQLARDTGHLPNMTNAPLGAAAASSSSLRNASRPDERRPRETDGPWRRRRLNRRFWRFRQRFFTVARVRSYADRAGSRVPCPTIITGKCDVIVIVVVQTINREKKTVSYMYTEWLYNRHREPKGCRRTLPVGFRFSRPVVSAACSIRRRKLQRFFSIFFLLIRIYSKSNGKFRVQRGLVVIDSKNNNNCISPGHLFILVDMSRAVLSYPLYNEYHALN